MSVKIPLVSNISSRVIRVLGCNPGPMTLQGTNTYVIGTGKRRVLLDTGDRSVGPYTEQLNKVLQNIDVTIDTILVSHWHSDHIGGLKDVARILPNSDFKVWKFKRTDASNEASFDGIPMQYLEDGQEIKTDDATLRVVHTPGHTTDHISLWMEEEKAIFSGDCILGEGTTVFEDLHDYMKSLEVILNYKPNIVYPGHGPEITDPQERIQAYIDHRMKREEQILQVLKAQGEKTFTPMELVKQIYKDTPEELHLPASFNVKHHLEKLEKQGNVTRVNNEEWILKNGSKQ